MNLRYVSTTVFLIMMGTILAFSGCGGETERVDADLVISDLEFSIIQDGRLLYSVKVVGNIRNAGNVDVSDVVIMGNCPSCTPSFKPGEWSLVDFERTDDQRDVIRFLGRGERRNFEFKRLAFYSTGGGYAPPTDLPEELNVYVDSYQVSN